MDWLISALPAITPLGGLLALGVWIVRQVVVGSLIPSATHERILAASQETIRVLSDTYDAYANLRVLDTSSRASGTATAVGRWL